MELRTLKTFQRVAELESFSKAALDLGYSQAAVTIQIQQLEKELQTRLFDRFGKMISLTQQGSIFYTHVCRILQESEEAKLALRKQEVLQGHLRIGMTESLCASLFPELLHTYHQLHPHVSFRVETSSPELLLDMMNHNELDVVYFIDKRRYHPDWIKVLEKPEDIVFVASCEHPLCKKPSLTLDDILQEELILTERAASYRYELDQLALAQKKKIHPYLEIGNTEFLIHELLSHCQVSFLPYFCVKDLVKEKRLCILKPQDFHLCVCRQIVYHKNKWMTPPLQEFITLAQNT